MAKIDDVTRSRIMSCIRSKNTGPEVCLRKLLWKEGLRYRIHYDIIGRPDIAFPGKRVAVFVDGDFWHGYDFEKLLPKLKNDFWVSKIRRNIERDKEVDAELEASGWKVLSIWEHEIYENPIRQVKRVREIVS